MGQKLRRFQLKSSNPFVYARPVPLRKYQHPVLPPGNGPMVREGLLCELTFKWYGAESDLCLPGLTPCGCEEEHPPLHQRRCLDLVPTSYNCQSLSHSAFQVLSSHLSFSSIVLSGTGSARASATSSGYLGTAVDRRRPNPLVCPQLNKVFPCFCLLFIRVRLTRRMSTATFHIAAGVAHVKN